MEPKERYGVKLLKQIQALICFFLINVRYVSPNDSVSCNFERGLCGWTLQSGNNALFEPICRLVIKDDWWIPYKLECCIDGFRQNAFPWEVRNKTNIHTVLKDFTEGTVLLSEGVGPRWTNHISDLFSPEIEASFLGRCLTYNYQVLGKKAQLVLSFTLNKVDPYKREPLAVHMETYKFTNRDHGPITDRNHQLRASVDLPVGKTFQIVITALYEPSENGDYGQMLVDNLQIHDGICIDICGEGQFTCTDENCISVDHIGDSVKDCPDGSDEEDIVTTNTFYNHADMNGHCDTSLTLLPQECYKPEIMSKEIRNNTCYEVVLLSSTNCTTNNTCESSSELRCLFYCPQTCVCNGLSFKCKTANVPKIARSVDISYVHLQDGDFSVSSYRFLVHLNLSNCGLLTFEFHMIPNKLQVLDLSDNYIKIIDANFVKNQTDEIIFMFIFNNNPLQAVVDMWKLLKLRHVRMRHTSLSGLFDIKDSVVGVHGRENYFDFSYNNLTVLDLQDFFWGYSTFMNLSHNEIQEEVGPHIKVLDMNFNRIKRFQASLLTQQLFLQHNQLTKFPKIVKDSHMTFIDVGYNAIASVTGAELTCQNLIYLNLKGNKLSEIKYDTFVYISKLLYLDLSINRIKTVENTALHPLTNLQTLYLQRNLLTKIQAKLFNNLTSLTVLDLSFNTIQIIEKNGFMGLRNLKSLYLQSNQFKVYETIFSPMEVLTYLEVSHFTLCCAKPVTVTQDQCVAPKNEISSCDQLVDVPILGVFIWYMALLAVFGNSSVLIYRAVSWSQTRSKTQAIFTMNLSFADLLMGVYLYIIAFTDLSYKGKYGFQDDAWRHSILCTLSGILATLSSESSAFHVLLITLDRAIVLRYGLYGFRISNKMAKLLSIITWILCLIISLLPAVEKTYFSTFYSRSGICVSLPLSVIRRGAWEYSMVVFIGINFLLFLGIFVGQVLIFIEVINVGRQVQTEQARKREISLAKTLFAVVITDMLCWIPIGIIGMMTFFGVDVPSSVYAWIIVVVLPINSSLNPFLYTIVVYIREKRNENKKIADAEGGRKERRQKMSGKENLKDERKRKY